MQKETLLKGGFEGPLCWYKIRVFGIDQDDAKSIAPENVPIQKPVFFGATMQDYVCLGAVGKVVSAQYCKGPLTIKEFNTGHWVMWEEKDKVNQELLEWIQAL